MPTYGYECQECNEKFETYQPITADPLTVHEGCGGALRRLVYPVGISFKGSGFYVNDYARKSDPGAKADAGEKPAKPTEGGDKAESKPEKTEAKSEAKAETKVEPRADSKPASTTAASTT